MQDWPEQPKTMILDPWFSIWKNPKETMREILDLNPSRHVLALSAVAGFVEALDWASDENLGDSYSLIVVLLICAIVGPIGGLVFVHLSAWLFQKTGSWLGGKASFIETRSAIAWSSVPIIWTLLFWIPAIAIFAVPFAIFASSRISCLDSPAEFDFLPRGQLHCCTLWPSSLLLK